MTVGWCGGACVRALRGSAHVTMVIVVLLLLVDNMLLTVVDPILPDMLLRIENGSFVMNGTQSNGSLTGAVTSTNLTATIATIGQLMDFMIFSDQHKDLLIEHVQDRVQPQAFHDPLPVEPTDSDSETQDGVHYDVVSHSGLNNGGRYGYLVAAKGLAQFACSPFVAIIVTRFGYRVPLLVGEVILMASTVAFGFGTSYAMLFVTRVFQGMSSSITTIAGFALVAATFSDDTKRGHMIGIAQSGLSLGIIIGPVYGSLLYHFQGQQLPFLVLAAVALVVIGYIPLIALSPQQLEQSLVFVSFDHICVRSAMKLISDPYILIVVGNIFLLNLTVSIVLAFLPLRLMELENPGVWKLGVVVLPTSVGYLVAALVFPRLGKWLPRWLCSLLGLLLCGITLCVLAYSVTFTAMLVVTTILGVGLGMVSTPSMSTLSSLADLRHTRPSDGGTPGYGKVYALCDMAVCAAMFVGPLVGGPLVYVFGFRWFIITMAAVNFCYSLLSLFLRNPPTKMDIAIVKNVGDAAEHGDADAQKVSAIDTNITEQSKYIKNSKKPLDTLQCLEGNKERGLYDKAMASKQDKYSVNLEENEKVAKLDDTVHGDMVQNERISPAGDRSYEDLVIRVENLPTAVVLAPNIVSLGTKDKAMDEISVASSHSYAKPDKLRRYDAQHSRNENKKYGPHGLSSASQIKSRKASRSSMGLSSENDNISLQDEREPPQVPSKNYDLQNAVLNGKSECNVSNGSANPGYNHDYETPRVVSKNSHGNPTVSKTGGVTNDKESVNEYATPHGQTRKASDDGRLHFLVTYDIPETGLRDWKGDENDTNQDGVITHL